MVKSNREEKLVGTVDMEGVHENCRFERSRLCRSNVLVVSGDAMAHHHRQQSWESLGQV